MMKKNTTTIHINGCTVNCPAEQEQLYREVLADKWIDVYRIHVQDGEVITDMKTDTDEMDWKTMVEILVEENDKRYALAGKY